MAGVPAEVQDSAVTTGEEDSRPPEQQAAVNQIRRDLAEGFAFVRGRETTDGVAAMTLEEMISREIQAIENDESDMRLGRISEIRQIKQKVGAAVEQALAMPPETFDLSESQTNPANTRTDGSGPGESDE
jgi:hypothetical protein